MLYSTLHCEKNENKQKEAGFAPPKASYNKFGCQVKKKTFRKELMKLKGPISVSISRLVLDLRIKYFPFNDSDTFYHGQFRPNAALDRLKKVF